MSFKTYPGYTRIGRLFESLPQMTMGMDGKTMESVLIDERRFVTRFVDALGRVDGHLLLAKDNLPPLYVSADVLQYIDASRLRHSIFDTLDFQLESLRSYDMATILVERSAFDALGRALRTPLKSTGGRPEHPAKEFYAQRNFERQGMAIKDLQREMKDAVGSAPAEATIRSWEKAAEKT